MSIKLICPDCKSIFKYEGDLLTCSRCNTSFPVQDNIPILKKDMDYYFNPIGKAEMEKIFVQISTKGWDETLKGIMKDFYDIVRFDDLNRDEWLINLIAERRAGWKFLLQIPHDGGRFLNIGCGWDSTTFSLSRNFKEGVALDLTLERLKLISYRAIFHDINNLTYICGGDREYLPFPDEYFDCIVMNGVLEWVAVTKTGNPRKVQLDFLKEVRRVLRPEGQIYIGIENRLAYIYFGKRRDHHSGLWFGSLLPRFIARLYSKAITGRDYRTYTYSATGYKKLLKKAGFIQSYIYSPFPDYRDFDQIVDISNSNNMSFSIPNYVNNRIKKVFFRSSIIKKVIPSLGVFGKKSLLPYRSFIEELIHHLPNNLGINKKICKYRISMKEAVHVYLGTGNEIEYVLKLPLIPATAFKLKKQETNINRLLKEETIRKILIDLLPVPVISGTYQGQQYYMEKYVKGATANTIKKNCPQYGKIVLFANELIYKLHVLTKRTTVLNEQEFENILGHKIMRIGNLFWDEGISKKIESIRRYLKEAITGKTLNVVASHGDWSLANLIINKETSRINGVIDWCDFQFSDFPGIDPINIYFSEKINKNGSSFSEILSEAILNPENIFLGNNYEKEFFQDKSLKRDMVIITSIYQIHKIADYPTIFYLEDVHKDLCNIVKVVSDAI